MERDSVLAIVTALEERRVRYLIAGGLAVVAHGYLRFTADVDLLVALDGDNPERALAALGQLGYRPRAPVAIGDFADPVMRERWVREKNMTVFSLFSDRHRATEVDLFVEPPIAFDDAWARAVRKEVAPGLEAFFCSREDLIAMKSETGRPVDLEDIRRLKELDER